MITVSPSTHVVSCFGPLYPPAVLNSLVSAVVGLPNFSMKADVTTGPEDAPSVTLLLLSFPSGENLNHQALTRAPANVSSVFTRRDGVSAWKQATSQLSPGCAAMSSSRVIPIFTPFISNSADAQVEKEIPTTNSQDTILVIMAPPFRGQRQSEILCTLLLALLQLFEFSGFFLRCGQDSHPLINSQPVLIHG